MENPIANLCLYKGTLKLQVNVPFLVQIYMSACEENEALFGIYQRGQWLFLSNDHMPLLTKEW